MIKTKKKGNTVNYYIHREMGDRLDKVLEKEANRNNIKSRSELIGIILSEFLGFYEEDSFTKAKMAVVKLGEEMKK